MAKHLDFSLKSSNFARFFEKSRSNLLFNPLKTN